MKKLLPHNLDNGATAECGNFYKMVIVTAYDKYLPWIIERFIKLQMYEGFIIGNYNIYGTEHQTFYDEVLEQQEIENKKNITSTIINAINSGGYVMLRTDRYYVPGGEEYQKKHTAHPMLICGYDDILREFYLVDVSLNGVDWGLHAFEFSTVEEAYYAGLELMRNDFNIAFGPLEITTCCVFYPKSFNRRIRLKYIYDNICLMLKGGEFFNEASGLEKTKSERKIPIKRVDSSRRLGVSIYKSYYCDLYELLLSGYKNDEFLTGSFGVYHGLEILIQNKRGILYRLNYLINNGYIPKDELLLNDAEKLCSLLDTTRNILAKFYYADDVNILHRIPKGFVEAEEIERSVLGRAKDHIELYLSKTL